MTRTNDQAMSHSRQKVAGYRGTALIGSFLCAMVAAGVANASETNFPNRDGFDRDVEREVTHNEDGSTTIVTSGTLINLESGATATFDSSRTIIESESGREWMSEGTRTTFEGETISRVGSGSVVRGEDGVTKTRTGTVTNETTGDVHSRSSDLAMTRTEDGVQVVGTRAHTGPDGETVTRDIDRVRPARSDRSAQDRPARADRPERANVRPVRLERPNLTRPARPTRLARRVGRGNSQ